MTSAAPILLIERDRLLGEAIAAQLAADGFSVELARTARHARMLASECSPGLAVLGGLDSPRATLALLEEIRRPHEQGSCWESRLPALVIGVGSRELDALRAFEAGADDFVAMPVGYLELRARMRAILRRAAPPAEPADTLVVDELEIDIARRCATLAGRALSLRRMEFELLVHLAGRPDTVFTREELLRCIWGYRSAGSTRTVDSHASRLRQKLRAGGDSRWVIGIWGIGYRLR